MKVMLVDDEPSFHLLVKAVCEGAGYGFCSTTDSREAFALFEGERPDVVLLDVMMPYKDGYEVCADIRRVDADVAVLFLSAKGAVADKRAAFAEGGDDYLVKPFDEEELVMRLEALFRRSQRLSQAAKPAGEALRVGDFEFDSVRQSVNVRGEPVQLTPKEFQILYTLALNPGTVMSKEELIEAVWGREYLDDAISIAVYVRKMREKIEQNPAKPRHLKTAWGMGYSFEA